MNTLRKAVGMGSKKKGKKQKSPQIENQDKQATHARGRNWEEDETNTFLDACQVIQLEFGRTDLSFTTSQYNKLVETFNRDITDAKLHRTLAEIKNRIKTLKSQYTCFRELANKSGWGWSPSRNVPKPPTEEAWQELLNDGTGRWQYYSNKTFPWYDRLEAMCGGKMANCDDMLPAFTAANSATGSETGSSGGPQPIEIENEADYPNTGWNPDIPQMEETVQQSTPQSVGGSRNSGSQKRKSTDEGSEMSKGKKYNVVFLKKPKESIIWLIQVKSWLS